MGDATREIEVWAGIIEDGTPCGMDVRDCGSMEALDCSMDDATACGIDV